MSSIGSNIPGMGPGVPDLNLLQEINQAAIQELAKEQATEDLLISIGNEAAQVAVIEPDLPKLSSPDYQLLQERATYQSEIAKLLNDNSLIDSKFNSISIVNDLLALGISISEIRSEVVGILQANQNSAYSPDLLIRRAIGELVAREMVNNPSLNETWYDLRAESLVLAAPGSAVLINMLKSQFLEKGETNERADFLAKEAAVNLVDKDLSKNGVITPFYGVHPKLQNAVFKATTATLGAMENATTFSVFISDIAGIGNKLVNLGSSAETVNASGASSTEATEASQNVADSSEEMLNELIGMIKGLDLPESDKVSILSFMKLVATFLADYKKTMAEIEKLGKGQKKDDVLARMQAAVQSTEAQVSTILDRIEEYMDAMKRAEKMESMMGGLSIFTEVLGDLMIAIFSALFGAAAVVWIAATVGTVLLSVVGGILDVALGIGSALFGILLELAMLIFTVVIVIFGIIGGLCTGGILAGVLAAALVVVALVKLAIQTIFTIFVMAIQIAMKVVMLVLALIYMAITFIFLLTFLMMALMVVSKAVTDHTDVTAQLADAFGPAMQELLKQLDIDAAMETCYIVMIVAPIVVAVIVILAPFLAIALVLIVIPLIATLGAPLIGLILAALALIAVLVAMLGSAIGLITGPLIAVLGAVLEIIVIVLVVVVALLPIILMALLLVIIVLLAFILGPLLIPMCMVILQWLPIFIARSGLTEKFAGALGGALGLSEDEQKDMEMYLTVIIATGPILIGLQPVSTSYETSDTRRAKEAQKKGETEYSLQNQLKAMQDAIKAIMAMIAMRKPRADINFIAENRRLESLKEHEEEELDKFNKIMADLIKQIQGLMEAMLNASKNPDGADRLAAVKKAFSEFFSGSISPIMSGIKVPFADEEGDKTNFEGDPNLAKEAGDAAGEFFVSLVGQMKPEEDPLRSYVEREYERYNPDEEKEDQSQAAVYLG